MKASINESIGVVHPWRRYFGRIIDGVLLTIIIVSLMFASMALEIPFPTIFARLLSSGLVLTTLLALSTIFFNASQMALTGNTFGKYLTGVKIVNAQSKKLSFKNALHREFYVYIYGAGFGVPLITFFTLYCSRRRLKKMGATFWDEYCKCSVIYRVDTFKHKLFYAIGIVIFITLIVLKVWLDLK